jgi:putative aldouronate transport system permease protein
MKHVSHLASIASAVLLIIGSVMVISFSNNVENIVNDDDAELTSYEVSMIQETEPDTWTSDATTPLTKCEHDVYRVTIANNSGKTMDGWALEIYVGDGYNASDFVSINKKFSILYDKNGYVDYDFNTAVEDGYLVITPGNYTMEDGELVADTAASGNYISTIDAGTLTMTLVMDGISTDAEVKVTDGARAQSMEWRFPTSVYIYIVLAILMLITSLVNAVLIGPAPAGERMEMETQYQLFLMFLPFIILIFAFSYLPLYGWRFAFVWDETKSLTAEGNFAGTHWFTVLFADAAFRKLFLNVMKNTLGLSFLGLLTSWLPMVFAIFLNEVKNSKFKGFVTTFSTIPNFISWVLVYSIAFAIFSTDGLVSSLLGIKHNFLTDSGHLWIKMWAWGTWKGIGWSAIIYISGIAGIDQQLYEAASIDGAGRFQKMWNITLPCLLPTFVVMLVMSVAGILSNGMDQYLMFSNAQTLEKLNVLDLYVYNLVFDGGGQIPLSTVVGMGKSVISIILFFIANSVAKAIRGNGIV